MNKPDESAKTGINRRTFVMGTLGGAALATAPRSRTAASTQANSKIGIGVIGVGGRGTWLFRDLRNRAQNGEAIEVVAVCDVWDRRVEDRVAEAGGRIKGYRDYRELLAQPGVDAVVIATPDHWHSKQTIDAFNAGKDVYCEKPLTLYLEQAKQVAEASRKTGKLLQCGAGSASDGRWWTAAEIIKAGGIGPVIWFQGGAFRNDPAGDWNYPILPCKPGVDLDWDMWLGHKFGLAPKRPYDPERYSRFRKYWDYSGGLATDLLYHVYAHLAIAVGHDIPYRITANGGQPVHNLQNDKREVPTLFSIQADYPNQSMCFMLGTQECEDGIPDLVRGQKGVLTAGGPGVIVWPQAPFRNEVLDMAQQLECYKGAELRTHKEGDRTVLDEIRVPSRYSFDHMSNWLECIRTRQQPTMDADKAYKVMIPIALSVVAYRQSKVVYFDPKTERVVDRNPLA